MEPKESTIELFRFSDPRQERIYRKLMRLVGPGPAAFYRDACRLIATTPLFETTTHLVSHLLRETESALRDVLESVTERTKRLTKKSGSGEEKYKAEILAILAGLGISETDPVAQAWLRLPGRENSYALHKRAHRSALASPRVVDEAFCEFWDEMSAILDVVLEKFEAHYLAIFSLLDGLLAKSIPGTTDANWLLNHAPNNQVTFSYFFGKLTSPAWLGALRAEGFFKHAPEPDRDDEKGTIGFPPWPASRYLARMAVHEPESVIKVLFEIPDTDNIQVHADLCDAVLAMPAEIAARWAEKETKWVEQQKNLYFLLPEKLGALVRHLVKGDQIEVALRLARSLLAVLPNPWVANDTSEDAIYLLPLEPQARFGTWYYKRILEKNVPDLVSAARENALTLLCDLLESAIHVSRSGEMDKGIEDYSYLWRPAIEDHEQSHSYEIENLLVSAVRDAAEQIAGADQTYVPALVEKLERRSRLVFQRIALHLLRAFPDTARSLIVERLLNQKLLDAPWYQNEYRYLLKNHFGDLSPEERDKWLGLIEKGPLAQANSDEGGEAVAPERSEQEKTRWRRERLTPIVDVLPVDWKNCHPEWVEGLVAPTDFRPFSIRWTYGDSPSPKSTDELRAMSVGELVAFLKTWQPPEDSMRPSREGLRLELKAVVASDPERFASNTVQWQGFHPTYVHALLSGLHDAAKQKRAFPWSSVLNLCQWVIKQPPEVVKGKREGIDIDLGWSSARKAIADLLSGGFESEAGPAAIPFRLRTPAWEALKPLTSDPDPTQEDEARYGGSNMDPLTLSINTTRGEAMHAAVRYALWVRRHLEKLPNSTERIARGFDEMPEVREVLDSHLDLVRDPALAIRAVYGRWFPWLVLLDHDWAVAHVSEIFPSDELLHDWRDAAWETYIIFCAPYDSVFDVLLDEYSRTVEHIGAPDRKAATRPANPKEHLAEHLMVLYWRGKLSLDESDGLLAQFYTKADDTLRGHALSFVGRSLPDRTATVPAEIIEKLKILWERRLVAAQAAIPLIAHAAELVAFGWWFVSARFNDAWAIAQLTEVLKLVGKVELDHMVVERLSLLAVDMPRQVVECLRLMIEGDKEGWGILGWREYARTILTTAIQSPNAEARQVSVDLVHRLGARGYFEFRDLLQNIPAP